MSPKLHTRHKISEEYGYTDKKYSLRGRLRVGGFVQLTEKYNDTRIGDVGIDRIQEIDIIRKKKNKKTQVLCLMGIFILQQRVNRCRLFFFVAQCEPSLPFFVAILLRQKKAIRIEGGRRRCFLNLYDVILFGRRDG